MSLSNQKPPMGAELEECLETVTFPTITNVTSDVIQMMRKATKTPADYISALKERGISHREVKIDSHDSESYKLILSILQPATETSKLRPCVYYLHGGGFHWGDRLHTLETPTDIILESDAVCVSIEYRLSPDYPMSTSAEDCYTGLQWISEHAGELGINPKQLMIAGTSAGGLLAAITAILSRDRHGPELCGQCLICPALDDRFESVSSHQYVEGSDFMPRVTMQDVWKSALKGSDPSLPIPGRLEDLKGLPTTFLDVGSAEVLRDDGVAYASKLLASGVQVELHVWPGAFHGFDIFLPNAAVSQVARGAKVSWAKRVFEGKN